MDPAQAASDNRMAAQDAQQGPDLHPIAAGLAQLAQATGDPRLQQAAALVADVAQNPGGADQGADPNAGAPQGPPVQ